MFKYILFLYLFGFYSTNVQAMIPEENPEKKAATSPAAQTSDDSVVTEIATEFKDFVLVSAGPRNASELTEEEKVVQDAIVRAIDAHDDSLEKVLKEQDIRCRRNNIDLARVCRANVVDGRFSRSLIDYAIFAGCRLFELQMLTFYGSPIIYIDAETDSKTLPRPTLETAWLVEKNPYQRPIIGWLIDSNPQQPTLNTAMQNAARNFRHQPTIAINLTLDHLSPACIFFKTFIDYLNKKYPPTKDYDLYNKVELFVVLRALNNDPLLST